METPKRIDCADGIQRELRLGSRMREYGDKLGELSTDEWRMSQTDGVPIPVEHSLDEAPPIWDGPVTDLDYGLY